MIQATTRRRRGEATPCRPRVSGPLILPLLILLSIAPTATAATEQAAKKNDNGAVATVEQLAKEIQRLQDLLQRLTEEQKKETEELQKRIAQLEKKLREAETERKKEELEQILAEAEAATADQAEKEKEAESQRDTFVGRQRNLQAMNPEISYLGDISYDWTDSDVSDRFLLRGVEISFQAPLDPYTRFKGFLAGHQEPAALEHEHDPVDPLDEEHEHGHVNVGIEETYMEWVALPANMRLRVGQFRQQFGTLNRWHPHALASVELPFAIRNTFGHEGLVGLGFGLDWQLPGFWASSNGLTLEVVNADNDAAFAGSGFRNPTYLLRHTGFFDLGPDTYFEVGFNGVTGPNDDEGDLYTTVASVDINFVWEPVQRAKYRSVELRGEFLHTHRETADEEAFKSTSFYTYLSWRFSRRWIAGLRYDDAELPYPEPEIELLHGQTVVEGLRERAWSPFVTFWQSEFVRLRLQYQHASRDFAWAHGPEDDDRVWLQVTFAAGPHKHEAY